MRLILVSDMHGKIPSVPEGDVLIIGGDITPHLHAEAAINWVNNVFVPWLDGVPCRDKVFICGNHDFVFRTDLNRLNLKKPNFYYLQDSSVTLGGRKIHGSPWSVSFGPWVFMASDQKLSLYWNQIEEDTEILVVHGPPYGIMDAVPEFVNGDNETRWPGVTYAGSKTLLERIKQLKNLKLVVCGHIHEGYGVLSNDGTTFVNASMMDAAMVPRNKPIIFDL